MTKSIDRRRFLVLAAGGVALGALAALQGCSGGSDSSDPAPTEPTTPTTPTYTDISGSVSSNHGHSFTLTAAQQEAGQAVTITSRGGDHSHRLSLSADNVAAAAAGSKVSRSSSTDAGHSHTVTFN